MQQSKILDKNLNKKISYMRAALNLAKKGLGFVAPNPCVGAILVKNDKIVGQGYHSKVGGPHAEVVAINKAGKLAQDADLYVTLEPCNHYGKTPPCTELIAKSGIRKAYIACTDINPLVSGRGMEYLKSKNIEVELGVLESEAVNLNQGFFHRIKEKKPFIKIKIASSMDGNTSLNNGESKWITSEYAREDVQKLRANACAILTGVGTVNNDNPNLNVRNRAFDTQPKRFILDSHLSIKNDLKILQQENVFLVYGSDPDNNSDKLRNTKARLLQIPLKNNRVDLSLLISHLSECGINNLLVEAGPTLSGAMIEAGHYNDLIIYVAPVLLGSDANNLIKISQLKNMKQKISFSFKDIRMVGPDIRATLKSKKNGLD
ncbi:MAG: bifunctional diaminohydroxyphosphoribosylaminopyrimidine deaminase/5-amino-6-(5-phosphoribosylamino)uracil reductase RibD [Nitrosomonadales bacterium]|nr:bifunctional diaminohydroxyphosphoribosylaminopyrimidine deaminase/5-amino-6-(5-phosphoribosylamino)uracil reductase RibD [Nitrosomonadales bacterium]